MSYKNIFSILPLVGIIHLLKFVSGEKGSLTFVIDDTASMSDDIEQVMIEANKIFDTVMNSESSQIENFILVTFNDPDVKVRLKTKNRREFKEALSSISVHGGGDCPEVSMKGIETALEQSLPNSFFYVFTDASASDYTRVERVKSLSQDKRTQIVFVLTGICDTETSIDYLVYHELSNATNGQVFHLSKNEVNKILAYVAETVKNNKKTITSGTFDPGYNNTLKFDVDFRMTDLIVSVSGSEPKIDVTGPGGSKPPTEDIVRTSNIAIVKVPDPKPGLHTATVGSKSKTTAVVSAETSVDFKSGFSVFIPSTIADTTVKPIPDEESYVSAQLIIKKGNIELKSIQILEMDGKVIAEKPVLLLNEGDKFYVTTEPLLSPNRMFKVGIKGYDLDNKTPITRISSISIEPQKVWAEKTDDKAPVTTIEESTDNKAVVKYGEPIELRCKVVAHPRPKVSWHWISDETPELPSKMSAVNLPYDYVSVLKVDSVKSNGSYICKARNERGHHKTAVGVITTTKFRVIETPKDNVIEYNKEGSLTCKVESSPPANITWFRGAKNVIHKNENFEISDDGTTLRINKMLPELVDAYGCYINSGIDTHESFATLKISGLVSPQIDKSMDFVKTELGADTVITCSVIKGTPKPTIHWYFNREPLGNRGGIEVSETGEEIFIFDVKKEAAGYYQCIATNIVGRDSHKIDVVIDTIERPSIAETGTKLVVKTGERVTLTCTAKGKPTPVISWMANGTRITDKLHEFYGNSLSFVPTLRDNGDYTCLAENKLGTAVVTTQVEVYDPVYIEPPKSSTIEVMENSVVSLPCIADGYPQPEVTWIFHSMDYRIPLAVSNISDESGSKKFSKIKFENNGLYTCIASNIGSSANITYHVIVRAPPYIHNSLSNNIFKAIAGDLLFKILCNATGNPKPVISWIRNGRYISAGTDWFDIEDDGTLAIKRIDKTSEGTYTCIATNRYGKYSLDNKLIVKPELPTSSTISVSEGDTPALKCGVTYNKKEDHVVLWYKDGVIITNKDKLILNKVTRKDAGIYTCAVSTPTRSRSSNTRVIIIRKLRFISDEKSLIDLEEGNLAVLNCTATGDPKLTVTWWHNGKRIPFSDMVYSFEMFSEDVGKYFCVVKNNHGRIIRTFRIKKRDCELNVQTNLKEYQPLMLEESTLELTNFNTDNGVMYIPGDKEVLLACPDEFEYSTEQQLRATCFRETSFKVYGETLDFTELTCKQKWRPTTKMTGIPCNNGVGEIVKVGYDVRKTFVEIYDVCIDMINRVPLYTRHKVNEIYSSDVSPDKERWINDTLLPYDYDSLYDCYNQIRNSKKLGEEFNSDHCCYAKRQLVNPADLSAGLPQVAAYSYLNVVPQWSTCSETNWDELERRVRLLSKSATRALDVWTGTSHIYDLPNFSTGIGISDSKRRAQNVPRYLWKVVWDPATKNSLAIIQINIPDLKPSDLSREILCKDMCHKVDWMKGADWRNTKKGYVYCCQYEEFKRFFLFNDIPHEGRSKPLYRLSVLPSHYLK